MADVREKIRPCRAIVLEVVSTRDGGSPGNNAAEIVEAAHLGDRLVETIVAADMAAALARLETRIAALEAENADLNCDRARVAP